VFDSNAGSKHVGGDAERPEELNKYKCPLVTFICPEEGKTATGRCATEERVAVCGATLYDPKARDGSGMLVRPMLEMGWGHCTSDEYTLCPYYKWYSLIIRYMKPSRRK
jgi:hypothetical protein